MLATALSASLASASCTPKAPSTESSLAASTASATNRVAPAATSAASSASIPRVAPIASLVPRARTSPRPACPLTVEPGVALGPIDLGSTEADLAALGLPVTITHHDKVHGHATVGPLQVSLCAGKVVDIWIDDLRKAPDCVVLDGKPVPRTISRDALKARVGACTTTEHRTGGSFERCQDGGAWIGYGMGDFLQVRVDPRGYSLDDLCPRLLDDGSPVALTREVRARVIERAVDVRAMAKYWHPDTPGRDPLRIVRSPHFPESPAFRMFGSAVVWIDPSEASRGTAYLQITSFEATATRMHVAYEYPVEGVSTRVELRPSGDEWIVHHADVRER